VLPYQHASAEGPVTAIEDTVTVEQRWAIASRYLGPEGADAYSGRFSLLQVQHHGLLGHRRPQPRDLRPRPSNSTCSALRPGRPGTAAANASNAPCLAVRQIPVGRLEGSGPRTATW
jgi:hypothetical protein